MSKIARVVVGLALVALVASCGGESDWERNSIRPGHQTFLAQAYNSEDFIDSYNEEFGRRLDCDGAAEQLQFYGRMLGLTRQHIADGETISDLGFAWTEMADDELARVLANNDWMLENHCPGAIPALGGSF